MADLEEPSEFQPILKHTPESEPSVYLWILQVVIVLGFSSVAIWLSLTPKSPIYIITNAYIPALDGRNSTSHPTRNTSFLLNFEFFNPNKRMSIYYNDIYITLYYSDAVIGSKSLPGFYQGYRKTTTYEVLVNADQQFWKEITNGTTGLKVCLENVVEYAILGIKIKHHRIYKEAYVPVGSNGTMSGEKNIRLHHTSKMTKN